MVLSAAQVKALVLACQIGTPEDLCLTTMAVVMQESSACTVTQLVGEAGELGCAQIKWSTALTVDPSVTTHQLTYDNQRNMRIAVTLLANCKAKYPNDWPRMLVCYNRPADAATLKDLTSHPYYVRVRDRLPLMKRIKQRYIANGRT